MNSVFGSLFIVSTPLGNLKDITLRALNIMKNSHLIAAEDTRKSRILLNEYNIKTKMISYHEHNSHNKIKTIISYLKDGKNISLISDAGTPGISDPSYRLIRSAIENEITVNSIPGPSAFLTALTSSGLPTDNFYFAGFLPPKKGRKSKLEELSKLNSTLILYENPKRLLKTLNDIYSTFNNRPAVICKELTKIHETFHRGSLASLIENFGNINLKGEFVILVGKDKDSVYF